MSSEARGPVGGGRFTYRGLVSVVWATGLDLALLMCSLAASLVLVGAWTQEASWQGFLSGHGLVTFVLGLSVLAWRRLYRIDARYFGIYDLLNIALGTGLVALGLRVWEFVSGSVVSGVSPWALSVTLWLLSTAALASVRIGVRVSHGGLLTRRRGSRDGGWRRVLIVGAGDAGEMALREIANHRDGDMQVVGFVDDAPEKRGMTIHGVPVLGTVDEIGVLVERERAHEVLVAIPSATGPQMRRISEKCRESSARVKTLPDLGAFVSGRSALLPMFRDIQIEDLLGRKPLSGGGGDVAKVLSGERVLITGAGGSIGAELARQVARTVPSSLVLLGRGENSVYEIDQELRHTETFHGTPVVCDVRDGAGLGRVFDRHYPSVVIHAAAHKHVPLMEAVPIEAIMNNVFGTLNVVEESMRVGVKRFLFVSTDKAVKPKNVMGATKRLGEMIVTSAAARSECGFSVVRFGNVLGSRGSLVPTLQKQIARGGPLTITHPDMTRYFMTIPEAVSLVLRAGSMGERGEIFILDMGSPVRIVDLVNEMVRMHGLVPGQDIEIKFTGTRPGEKLHEELAEEDEDLSPSGIEGVKVASHQTVVDWDWLRGQLGVLRGLCDGGDSDGARAMLMDLAWGKNIPPVHTSEKPARPSR